MTWTSYSVNYYDKMNAQLELKKEEYSNFVVTKN